MCVCICVCVCVHTCECVFCLALGFTRYKGENEVCLERRGDSVCAWGGGGGVQEGPTTIHIIIKELGGISVAGGLESMPRKGEDEVYVSLCVERGFSVCVKKSTQLPTSLGGGGGGEQTTVHIIREPGSGLGISIIGSFGSTPYEGEDEVCDTLCVEERGFSVWEGAVVLKNRLPSASSGNQAKA